METTPSKACTQCNVVKPLNMFSREAKGPLGYASCCKRCKSFKNAARYQAKKKEALSSKL